jgi:sugar lactone lactonase YvrE
VTSGKFVHCITVDRKGRVWFGTNGGAYVYDGKTLTNISERDGLPNNAVSCILEDKSGNIWFGTFTGASVGLMERTSPTSRSKESLKARRSGAFTKVDPGTCGSPPSDLLCTDTTATHSRSLMSRTNHIARVHHPGRQQRTAVAERNERPVSA